MKPIVLICLKFNSVASLGVTRIELSVENLNATILQNHNDIQGFMAQICELRDSTRQQQQPLLLQKQEELPRITGHDALVFLHRQVCFFS